MVFSVLSDADMAMKSVLTVLSIVVFSSAHYDYGYNPHAKRYTPLVHLKEKGQLRGVVVDTAVGSCEQYLGIPYAAAPRGGLRFMPPGSAPPWPHLLYADTPGPVCPQKLPDIKTMVEERKEKYKKLVQHLTNQSEDCLFLNIYTPDQDTHRGLRKYPVIIYIHGQSYGGNYEWNSGNPYDGCVLSSYGKVVFITINYRLGILGFLKTGVGNKAHSNLGLKDQVAALLWVQENIAAFGGDPRSVTLMGHGSGAACVNFLMTSPMVVRDEGNELFHRAILMSGSALSDWALATNSLQLTLQVAQTLNCPSGDDELADCLRRKRLEEIMAVPVEAPHFVTKFGPVVDGLAVPNVPKKLMATYNDLFSRYEMMFGLTEIESDHLLNGEQLTQGLRESDRNEILRKYLQARFDEPDKALDSTLREYANLSLTSSEYFRDTVLKVLSDARVAAPVVQTGNYHSAINPKSYFYVFGYSTISKDYLREKSLHGEELQYVFGAPLGGARDLFTGYYSEKEKLFSEIIMTLWTNFAHTGNPMAPRRNSFHSMRPDWEENWPRDWPEYDTKNQPYMLLAIPPVVQYKYREPLMEYWNDVLPKKLKNNPLRPPILSYNPVRKPPVHYIPNIPSKYVPLPPFFRTSTEHPAHFWKPVHTTSPTFGTVREYPIFQRPAKDNFQGTKLTDIPKNIDEEQPKTESANTTMNIIIIVGVLFLLVNVLTFAGLYYKRKRLRTEERNLKRQYEETNLLPISEVSPEKKPKIDEEIPPGTLQRGCNVMQMIRQSTKSEDTYEAVVKQSEEGTESNPKYKLARQISTSTIDPHTKVRDWIAHEIVQRCSPRFLRKTRQQFALEHKLSQQRDQEKKKATKTSETKTLLSTPTTGKNTMSPVNHLGKQSSTTSTPKTGSKNISTKSGIPSTKPRKVSVAIDATPGARGSSVLKQQPIELSKSMDLCSKEPEVKPLRRSVTMDDFLVTKSNNESNLQRSITNISLKKQAAIDDDDSPIEIKYATDSDIIKIHHQHSRSDPVKMTPGEFDDIYPQETIKLKTFDATQDINVTSRDETFMGPPLSPEESLQTIKRRNFPKVLPDFPDQQKHINAMKRRSLPAHNLLLPTLPENKKLQPQCSSTLKNFSRVPPAPPPRTSSTLGRKPSMTGIPICHPCPKFAEEPPTPEEPPITSNTLLVGPIIPSRKPRKPTDIEVGVQSFDLNTQPIYDNLRTPADKEAAVKMKKSTPKTIITTDPDQPVKKIEQPKVIIKPSVTKKLNDPTKINKVIPRVVAKDLSVESEASTTKVEDKKKEETKQKPSKFSLIPTFSKSSTPKSQSSSDSSSSTFDGSDTGTVVKRA